MTLRTNQKKAIESSLNNDFNSGVHFHATGTGKSWIGLELILKYNEKYPKNNILWLCEQKSILIEQFDTKTLLKKGYSDISKKFLIINYTENKPKNWYNNVNSAIIWNRPILLIINRAFLVSARKYEKMSINIGLIMHDECHSISNNTTKEFYKHIIDSQPNTRCIGFSATPAIDIQPFDNIISKYTIYDAYRDKVIVKPCIKWIKSEKKLNSIDMINIVKRLIETLPYKKIIVWCGMIKECHNMARLWSRFFKNYTICIDTSIEDNNFGSIEQFRDAEFKAILFCACKHREGSDIKNLDCCVFLDGVQDRSPRTFIQCIGRVLRKDPANIKKYGLIIDFKASSCIKICDRMNYYLNAGTSFPWKYTYTSDIVNKKEVIINSLVLRKGSQQKSTKTYNEYDYTIKDVVERFIISCPNDNEYTKRLCLELEMIDKKNLSKYLVRATEILKMTDYIPHVTRGSCGSSLVCYLLGISNVDPIKNNIKFERFLNSYRDNLPDIDFDFPHNLRDEVFLRLELKWPNQVARISNHVHWHEKSAIREALRMIGVRKHVPKEDINKFVKSLDKSKQALLDKHKNEMVDTFRHYSLHCGGIVFFHDGIPEDIKINSAHKTLSQIIYDKRDIADKENFKIDILSSRGISQIIDVFGKDIDFNDCPYDEKIYTLLQKGENIGLTLAESPLMRKALKLVRPKNIDDIAKCLAIIRPAAKDTRLGLEDVDFDTPFVYDDDAIEIISKTLSISYSLADKFRRCISKGSWDKDTGELYETLLSNIDKTTRDKMKKTLANLRKYSFCKSHSYSYAQLVYKLAFCKVYYPKAFWKATLKNVRSSYRKWVHIFEAYSAGVSFEYIQSRGDNKSIYSKHRNRDFDKLDIYSQIKKYGYWDMSKTHVFPNTYFYEKDEVFYFGGLIASIRCLGGDEIKKWVVCLCIGVSRYIEIIISGKIFSSKFIGLKGRGKIRNITENSYIASFVKYF